jgi:hypothetical protein
MGMLEDVEIWAEKIRNRPPEPTIEVVSRAEYERRKRFYEEGAAQDSAVLKQRPQ